MPFKPGESGNPDKKFSSTNQPPIPGGVFKKGSKHISTWIQEMLNDESFELKLKSGKIIKGAPLKAIIETAIIKAVSGDTRAFDILGKYGWGVKQTHEFEGNPVKQILEKYGLDGNERPEDTKPQTFISLKEHKKKEGANAENGNSKAEN